MLFQLRQLLRDFCHIGIFILQQREIFLCLSIIGFQPGYLFFQCRFFCRQRCQIFFQRVTLFAVFTGQCEDFVIQLLFFRIPLSQLFFQLRQLLRDFCHTGIFILQQGEIFFRLSIIGFQPGNLFFQCRFFCRQCCQVFFQRITLFTVFTGQCEDFVTQLLFFRIPLSQLFFQLRQLLRDFCHIGIFAFQQREIFICQRFFFIQRRNLFFQGGFFGCQGRDLTFRLTKTGQVFAYLLIE